MQKAMCASCLCPAKCIPQHPRRFNTQRNRDVETRVKEDEREGARDAQARARELCKRWRGARAINRQRGIVIADSD